jgi:hypothetical protein
MLVLELDVSVRNLGSTALKRKDLARGFEPDTCFYMVMQRARMGPPAQRQ